MKKFHWGHAILIFFIFYVGTLAFILYKSTTIDHSLVVEDYYNQDINYQKKYDKVKNVANYKKAVDVNWLQEERILELNFGQENIRNGNIMLYNPADNLKDLIIDIENESTSSYRISDLKLAPGRWKVKIDWIEDDVPFYIENEIYIVRP